MLVAVTAFLALGGAAALCLPRLPVSSLATHTAALVASACAGLQSAALLTASALPLASAALGLVVAACAYAVSPTPHWRLVRIAHPTPAARAGGFFVAWVLLSAGIYLLLFFLATPWAAAVGCARLSCSFAFVLFVLAHWYLVVAVVCVCRFIIASSCRATSAPGAQFGWAAAAGAFSLFAGAKLTVGMLTRVSGGANVARQPPQAPVGLSAPGVPTGTGWWGGVFKPLLQTLDQRVFNYRATLAQHYRTTRPATPWFSRRWAYLRPGEPDLHPQCGWRAVRPYACEFGTLSTAVTHAEWVECGWCSCEQAWVDTLMLRQAIYALDLTITDAELTSTLICAPWTEICVTAALVLGLFCASLYCLYHENGSESLGASAGLAIATWSGRARFSYVRTQLGTLNARRDEFMRVMGEGRVTAVSYSSLLETSPRARLFAAAHQGRYPVLRVDKPSPYPDTGLAGYTYGGASPQLLAAVAPMTAWCVGFVLALLFRGLIYCLGWAWARARGWLRSAGRRYLMKRASLYVYLTSSTRPASTSACARPTATASAKRYVVGLGLCFFLQALFLFGAKASLFSSAASLLVLVAQASPAAGSAGVVGCALAQAHRRLGSLAYGPRESAALPSPLSPQADIDPLTSTDFEELMTFAADIFEFLHQEYALFICTFGESYVWGCAAGALLFASHARRVLSNRRFK